MAIDVRLALAEAAWLTEDMAAAQRQLALLAGTRLDDFQPYLPEMVVWWRRCGMAEPFPSAVSETGLPLARAAEMRGDPRAAAAEWTRLGLPYEAALAGLQATGPDAAEALVAARIARCVIALIDPDPRVDGGGVKKLAAAGIAVETGLRETEARAIKTEFLSRFPRRQG